MIDRNNHHVAALAQAHAVVKRTRTRSIVVGAAMNVEHDGPLASITQRRRPYIQEEAILVWFVV